MTSTTFAGATVEVNEEGFFVDPTVWTPKMASEMAAAARNAAPLSNRVFTENPYFLLGCPGDLLIAGARGCCLTKRGLILTDGSRCHVR